MAFSLQVDNRYGRKTSSRSSLSTQATLVVFSCLAAAFCIYDIWLGQGHVLSALAQMQRSVQGVLEGLRPRI